MHNQQFFGTYVTCDIRRVLERCSEFCGQKMSTVETVAGLARNVNASWRATPIMDIFRTPGDVRRLYASATDLPSKKLLPRGWMQQPTVDQSRAPLFSSRPAHIAVQCHIEHPVDPYVGMPKCEHRLLQRATLNKLPSSVRRPSLHGPPICRADSPHCHGTGRATILANKRSNEPTTTTLIFINQRINQQKIGLNSPDHNTSWAEVMKTHNCRGGFNGRPLVQWPTGPLALGIMELSLPGTFVPCNFRSRERKFQELSFPGTFAPWNFRSREQNSKNFRSQAK